MNKLKFGINESAGAIASAKGFWYHPSEKVNIAPSQQFDFLYIGMYPLNQLVYIWDEGNYTCLLQTIPVEEKYQLVLRGKLRLSEKLYSPKYLIEDSCWTFTNENVIVNSLFEAKTAVKYFAERIKSSGGLLNTGFPKGWKLAISSKVLSTRIILNGLSNK